MQLCRGELTAGAERLRPDTLALQGAELLAGSRRGCCRLSGSEAARLAKLRPRCCLARNVLRCWKKKKLGLGTKLLCGSCGGTPLVLLLAACSCIHRLAAESVPGCPAGCSSGWDKAAATAAPWLHRPVSGGHRGRGRRGGRRHPCGPRHNPPCRRGREGGRRQDRAQGAPFKPEEVAEAASSDAQLLSSCLPIGQSKLMVVGTPLPRHTASSMAAPNNSNARQHQLTCRRTAGRRRRSRCSLRCHSRSLDQQGGGRA